MTDIFLSYNREDQARAKLFADAFAAQGFDVWWDVGLRAGEAYDEVTETALRTAKAVVVLWSQRSVQSRWVRAEATLADRNKTLVPCMIEPCERPIMFELTQTAELSHWSGAVQDPAWQAFLADVTRFVGAAPRPAPPPPAPGESIRAVAGHTVLAVLAFENLSADAELQYFSDGVAEEILAAMSRAPDIRVIGSTSTFAFRGERKKDAASALGATHVLDGSVRRGGNRVRIAATLTEAGTGQVLWTERFDRQLDDALAVQDEIAELTAAALQAKLRPAAPAAPVDPEAYDLYLRALAERRSSEDAAQERAIALLEAAVAPAPGYARAHSALAMALGHRIRKATLADAAPDAFENACAAVKAAAERALGLDPADIEAKLALLSLKPVTETWAAQERLLTEALAANPTDSALLWYRMRWLVGAGRFREGERVAALGYELNPLSPIWMAARGSFLMINGDMPAADELLKQAWMNEPHHLFVWYARWAFLGVTRQFEEAWRLLSSAPASYGDIGAAKAWLIAMERPDDAEAIAAYIVETNIFRESDYSQFPQGMSGLATVGQVDAVFECAELRISLTQPERLWSMWHANGYGPGTESLLNPWFLVLHADPRFLPLCHRLGLCAGWVETGHWPDFITLSPNRAALEARVRKLAVS